MEKNYRTDRHLNPVALTTSVAKSLGWKQGVDYEVGDPFRTESGSVLHTARLKVPQGMSALEFTKKKFDDSYNSGADVFYTQKGQPRWTHTAIKKEDWQKMDDNQKLATVAKMYKNEGGSGVLSKGVSYEKEPGLIQKGLKAVGNFLLPTASASDGKEEPMYAGDFKPLKEMPMGSGGFVAKKAPKIDYNDINAVRAFVDENGGLDERDQQAFRMMTTRYGMTKEDAIREVAKKKAYFMENPEQTLEGLSLKTDEENSVASQAATLGRFGAPEQPLNWLGEAESLPPEQVAAAKDELMSLRGGWNEIAAKAGTFNPAQKEAMIGILQDEYAKYAQADQAMQESAASKIRGLVANMAGGDTEARARIERQVFGMRGAESDSTLMRYGVTLPGNVARGVMDAIGLNPSSTAISSAEKLAGAESGWEAGNALLKAAGGAAATNPIGAAVSTALTNLNKTNIGSKALQAVMSVPGWAAEQVVSLLDIPDEQKGEATAFIRDLATSMAVRGVSGAAKGGKAGLNASPAASSASKVGSAIVGAAKTGIVEGAKGILDPFKFFSKAQLPTAKSDKVISDAAKRVQSEVDNMTKNFAPNERISKEDLVRAAIAKNKFGDLTDVKDLAQAEANVANAKQSVVEQFQKEAGSSPVPFDKVQLSEGITDSVKKSLGGRNLDVTTSKLVDNMVNQIWDGITDTKGNVVGTLSDVHAMTAKMYDTILGAGKDAGVLNVNSMKAYLAIKEALYGELAKVEGFSQYLDDYRNLSRVEDLVKLSGKKSMTDVGRKSLQESVPPSWAGILGGAGVTGSWGIAGSVLAAGLLSRIRQGNKSVVRLNSSINKVAEALKAAGPDGGAALKKALGIVDEAQLGSSTKPISSYTPSSVIEKAKMDEKFPSNEPGQTVGFGQSPSKAEMAQQFEAMRPQPMKEPGETVGFGPSPSKAEIEDALNPKPITKTVVKAPAKKPAPRGSAPKPESTPVESPKKASVAPKATKAPEKPKTAPKAKETEKKATPVKVNKKEVFTQLENMSVNALKAIKDDKIGLSKYANRAGLTDVQMKKEIDRIING